MAENDPVGMHDREILGRLAAERDFLARILDTIPVGVLYLDREFRYRYCNATAAAELGLPVEDILGRTFEAIAPDNPELRQSVEQVLITGHPAPGSVLSVRWPHGPSETAHHYLMAFQPDIDIHGRTTGVFIEGQDITELVETRLQLEIERDRMRTLLESIADEIWFVDARGEIAMVNPAAAKGLGFASVEELFASLPEWTSVIELYTPDGQPLPRHEVPLMRSLQGEVIRQMELLVRHPKTGELRHRQLSSAPLLGPAGEIVGAVGVARDVTERRQLERSLRDTVQALNQITSELESRVNERTAELLDREANLAQANQSLQYYAFLLENLSDAVVATDEDGHITAWNRAAEGMFGWRADEVLGRPAREAVLERMVRTGLETLNRSLNESGAYRGEVLVFGKEGSRVWLEATVLALQDEAAHTIGYLAVARDITERKQAEAEMARYTERLRGLHQIGRAILEAQSVQGIAQAAVRHVRELVQCDRAGVILLDHEEERVSLLAADGELGDGLEVGGSAPLDVYQQERRFPLEELGVVPDLAAFPKPETASQRLIPPMMRAVASAPLHAEGRVIGHLNLWRKEPGSFPQEQLDIVQQVADSLAVAIHNARLFEQVTASRQQLQRLSRRLVEAQEDERRYIARELHDEAGQSLTSIMLGLGAIQRECNCSEDVLARVAELKEMTDEVMEGLHRLVANLRPAGLDRLGLQQALRNYVSQYRRQTQIDCYLIEKGLEVEKLPPEVEITLYRLVQEALTNIARHAGATQARVIVKRRGGRILAIVEDNGTGFNTAQAARQGFGLSGMQERAEALGGRMHIKSVAGQGTTVFVDIPIVG